jgi:Fe-S cluster assembly protein SufD
MMSETLIESGLTEKALPSPRGEPGWTRALREEAFALFRTLPIPSQETEEWRYTDLSGLEVETFVPFASGQVSDNLDGVAEQVQAAVGEIGERAGLLVQHNSETATVHLAQEEAERGVIFLGLDRALLEHSELLEKRLHRLVPAERTKFLALHAAFRTGGLFVYVPADVKVELPLQSLVYVDSQGLAVFPHTVIVAEQGSEVTVIERFVSRPLERALSDAVTEIFVGPGARVRYVSLQDWGEGMTHLSVQRAMLDRDADLRSLAVAFGGSLSRTEVESVLSAPGGHSEMLGVYFTDGSQHFDHRSLQDHVAPQCGSEVLYKGALKGRSRAVYSGWVHVRKDAQKTNAFQTNRNIVLSEEAKADSIPNLEIEANDVRCGHAASVGPVDEDVRFYMQSRGIPADEAERLIVTGFFQEVLDRVGLDEVREGLERAIEAELEKSD